MKKTNCKFLLFSGFLAGTVNGLLGSGGGMLLVPLLTKSRELGEKEIYSVSVIVMLLLSIVTLLTGADWQVLRDPLLPFYMVGSCSGGIAAGVKPLPIKWLHKIFGAVMITAGIRCLCS